MLVALVLLMVMTVIAVAGLSMAVLQQRMANNLRSTTRLSQVAQAALAGCEQHVRNPRYQTDPGATGMASSSDRQLFRDGNVVYPAPAELFVPSVVADFSRHDSRGYRVACLIENAGTRVATGPGCSLRLGDGRSSCMSRHFSVTVRAGYPLASDAGTFYSRPLVIVHAGVRFAGR